MSKTHVSLWRASMRQWLKGHELTIESCDLKIKHLREEIALNKKAIALELKERAFKLRQKKHALSELAKNADQ